MLAPGGALIVELGAGQADAVAALFAAAGLAPSPPRTDLNGVPRALIAEKGMSAEHWPPKSTQAKKHLECRAEPTSLRARNRPEMRAAALP